jgi:hypothetical protein
MSNGRQSPTINKLKNDAWTLFTIPVTGDCLRLRSLNGITNCLNFRCIERSIILISSCGNRVLPNPALLQEVADHVSPQADIYVRYWLSRVVRPNVPLPSQLPTDYPLLGQLPATDSQSGWVRIAYYETERILSEESILAEVTKTLRISAGFGIPRPGESYPIQGALPFGIGELNSWRDTNSHEPLFRGGPLIGFTFLTDFLGILPVLGLSARLTNRLSVKASDALGRLQLLDAANQPCVIFRQWHVRPLGERPSRSADRNSGCDLIVRSDIWEAIGDLYANQLILPSLHRSEDDY